MPHLLLTILYLIAVSSMWTGASAQAPVQGPPAVGVVTAEQKPLTEANEFVGRIQATQRVAVVARLTGFLERVFFEEGAEVQKGDALYRIEQPPYQADLEAKRSQVAQLQAQLTNAQLNTERARTLLSSAAGQQSTYDQALAQQRSLEAQVLGAQAQLRQSEISLGYTDITSPISGRVGRTSITQGNVVSPTSGVLTTVVSQDPMYVTFPVSVRTTLSLRERYAPRGGFEAVRIRIRLPDGRMYAQQGTLNFADNTVTQETDTLILRGTIPNPPLPASQNAKTPLRELFDGEFVTVVLESAQPVLAVAVPRAAVLSDMQGNYVFVVGPDNKAEQRRVELGQSTPGTAFILSGLKEGERVVLEGIQRVRPGQPVSPGPAATPNPGGAAAGSGNAAQPTSISGPAAQQGQSGLSDGGQQGAPRAPPGQGTQGPSGSPSNGGGAAQQATQAGSGGTASPAPSGQPVAPQTERAPQGPAPNARTGQ
jgi:membrane fusion protein (multidrug efflux system)